MEYDRTASKERVKKSRERQKANRFGQASPKRKPKETPIIPISEEQRFADFLQLARGNNTPEHERLFIKRKLPGEWKIVFEWLKEKRPDTIWLGLNEKTKAIFRRAFGVRMPDGRTAATVKPSQLRSPPRCCYR